MSGHRWIAVSTKFTFSLCVLVVMLGLVEVVLRVAMPLNTAGYYGAYRYDEKLGYRLKSDSHYLILSDHLQEIRTNSIGIVNFQETFEPYDQLVFALGDSYTQGTGVAADEAYPFQLDLLLNLGDSHYKQRFGVVNLGLAAFGMEQSMLVLSEFASTIGNPDIVLFFGCSNDHADDALFLSGYRPLHLVDGNPNYGIWLGPLRWFSNETEIGGRLKLMRAQLRRQRIVTSGAGDSGAGVPKLSVAGLQAERFDRLLEQTHEMGARLIVSWTDWEDAPGQSYQWLNGWAARNDVDFADWHRGAHAVHERIPSVPYTNPHSAGHYRTWVYQVIARALADEILKADLGSPAPTDD